MTTIEKIKAEIERRISENKNQFVSCSDSWMRLEGEMDCLIEILSFIESLEKSAQRSYKDCNGCEYNRTVKDQIGWTFRGCFGGNYQGKPIAEIELCPLKVESLEKEQQADETLMEKDKIDTAFTKMMEKEQPKVYEATCVDFDDDGTPVFYGDSKVPDLDLDDKICFRVWWKKKK